MGLQDFYDEGLLQAYSATADHAFWGCAIVLSSSSLRLEVQRIRARKITCDPEAYTLTIPPRNTKA